MDYLKFYGLEEEPFVNDPMRRFFYESRSQAHARLRLVRGIQQGRGLLVVVGEPGRGKTTLARHLLETLDQSRYVPRMLPVPHSACEPGWLLPRIAHAFGVAQPATAAMHALGQLYERLVAVRTAGKQAVLLVDEAQFLRNPGVMEEFRSLLNLEHQGRRLLCLVLVGLPDLADLLRLDGSLAQRVDIRVAMRGFDSDETRAYLEHRLKCVGGSIELFREQAIDVIYTYTRGVPRLINTLADNALFEGALEKSNPVDASVVAAAAEELDLEPAGREDATLPVDEDAEPTTLKPSSPFPTFETAEPTNAAFPGGFPGAAPPPAAPPPAPATPAASWLEPLAPEGPPAGAPLDFAADPQSGLELDVAQSPEAPGPVATVPEPPAPAPEPPAAASVPPAAASAPRVEARPPAARAGVDLVEEEPAPTIPPEVLDDDEPISFAALKTHVTRDDVPEPTTDAPSHAIDIETNDLFEEGAASDVPAQSDVDLEVAAIDADSDDGEIDGVLSSLGADDDALASSAIEVEEPEPDTEPDLDDLFDGIQLNE